MLSKMDKLPNIENTIKAEIFLLAKAKTISETINDTQSKNKVIQIYIRALPNKNMILLTISRVIFLYISILTY